jgi:DNA-binding XRE family transcriptional regulator
MPRGRVIGPKDRLRIFELASQGLSLRQIAKRFGISAWAVRQILAKGLIRCGRCGRLIDDGDLCPVCSLPAQAPFGERLRAFRMAADVSQWRLAMKIDVAIAKLRNWESGRKQPTERELTMLAEALEITVQELTGKGGSQKGG